GMIVWRLPSSEKLAAPLVAGQGRLVAVTSTAILVLRAADGSVAWRRDLESPPHAAPTLAGDRVYVPLEDRRVLALRFETGEPIRGRRRGGAPNDVRATADRIFVGSRDDFLYCVNARDGEVEWRVRTGADVVGLPIVDERRVYFVSLDNVLRALNQSNGV